MIDRPSRRIASGRLAFRLPSSTQTLDRMMKKLSFALAGLVALMATPALACPMMQQAAATGSGAQTTAPGGMCALPATTTAQVAPGQPGQPAPQAGGCSCCRNMAMMQMPPNQGMPGMGGMGSPAPEAPQSDAPATPEQPNR